MDGENEDDGSLLNMDAAASAGGSATGGQEQTQQAQQAPQGQGGAPGQSAGRYFEFNGERIEVPPELWDDKAGTPNVGAAIKRAIDLRRQVGALPKAPDEYKLDLPDAFKGKVEFDAANDPMFKQAAAWGKKHGISQAAMDELAPIYWGNLAGAVDGDAAARSREMGVLLTQLGGDTGTPEERGGRAKAEMTEVAKWAAASFAVKDDGNGGKVVDQKRLATLKTLTSTADGVLFLRDLRAGMAEAPIPGRGDTGGQPTRTRDELESMMRDRRYGKDEAFTRQVHEGFRKLYGE